MCVSIRPLRVCVRLLRMINLLPLYSAGQFCRFITAGQAGPRTARTGTRGEWPVTEEGCQDSCSHTHTPADFSCVAFSFTITPLLLGWISLSWLFGCSGKELTSKQKDPNFVLKKKLVTLDFSRNDSKWILLRMMWVCCSLTYRSVVVLAWKVAHSAVMWPCRCLRSSSPTRMRTEHPLSWCSTQAEEATTESRGDWLKGFFGVFTCRSQPYLLGRKYI